MCVQALSIRGEASVERRCEGGRAPFQAVHDPFLSFDTREPCLVFEEIQRQGLERLPRSNIVKSILSFYLYPSSLCREIALSIAALSIEQHRSLLPPRRFERKFISIVIIFYSLIRYKNISFNLNNSTFNHLII